MKRNKHHKVKKEMPATSSSQNREYEEHDLAYYIHDRVELMHQVFSVIKYKELKLMAPACVRNISIDDLQELCTEELLGISSKRLCAILDGAEPPSDTESSSQSANEPLETISLDSISSDEEILSQDDKSKKKKHKHRRRDSKSRRKKSKEKDNDEDADKSKASRAGLTVLELLELQARARAIRAQLQQEQPKLVSDSAALESTQSTQSQSSEDEVEIKEEPAEVVEISSDEEKPKIEQLATEKSPSKSPATSKTVTKRVNDLVITVPQQKTQKIKLKRPKSIPQDITTTTTSQNDNITTDKTIEKVNKDISKEPTTKDKSKKDNTKESSTKDKGKTKKKKKKRLSNASDNDEITLQLSDTEKMDLLEDLDSKTFDNVSSDSSSDSGSDTDAVKKATHKQTDTNKDKVKERKISRENRKSKEEKQKDHSPKQDEIVNTSEDLEKEQNMEVDNAEAKETESVNNEISGSNSDIGNSQSSSQTDIEKIDENKSEVKNIDGETQRDEELRKESEKAETTEETTQNVDKVEDIVQPVEDVGAQEKIVTPAKELSEGELSDRESSEVEAIDLKPEVVCISDEEGGKPKKKKKKKDKKSKKEKRSKKKDFRESADHNFHNIPKSIQDDSSKSLDTSKEETKDTQTKNVQDNKISDLEIDLTTPDKSQDITRDLADSNEHASETDNGDDSPHEIVEISDEVYELSGDSSNEDESETQTVLSKEPTASEIEALSAKIDEIERVEVITEEEIREYESKQAEVEPMSWKERYLDSKKVKKVLNTSNILNALRKKNRQLKKRLEESKIESQENAENAQEVDEKVTEDLEIAEGSIEHYNTLQGSTKYVDPVKEIPINDNLKKDAKQLLRMYKKLLKYNDMSRQRDPNKRKRKKKSKKDQAEENKVEVNTES